MQIFFNHVHIFTCMINLALNISFVKFLRFINILYGLEYKFLNELIKKNRTRYRIRAPINFI